MRIRQQDISPAQVAGAPMHSCGYKHRPVKGRRRPHLPQAEPPPLVETVVDVAVEGSSLASQ